MSAKTKQIKEIKNEKTWIESLVDVSKEVVLTKFYIAHVKQLIGLGSRLQTRFVSADSFRHVITEAERRIQELTSKGELILTTHCTKDKIEIPKGFYASTLELESGYCILEQRHRIINDKDHSNVAYRKVVLFLSDNEDTILEPIKAGDILQYEDVKTRLSKCKSVMTSRVKDILIKKYKNEDDSFLLNNDKLKKYKSIQD